jgi:hypothetical protein
MTPPKKRGGKRAGAGRKPGSTKPEKRLAIAESFYLRVGELIKQGCPKPKEQAAIEAYERDHPDRKRDLEKYIDTHRKLRRRALSEEQATLEEDLCRHRKR